MPEDIPELPPEDMPDDAPELAPEDMPLDAPVLIADDAIEDPLPAELSGVLSLDRELVPEVRE
jgi:hypothetical protein